MRREQRGMSLSAFFAVVVLALLLVAGLVVDGGAQAAAARRAELVEEDEGADRLVGVGGNRTAHLEPVAFEGPERLVNGNELAFAGADGLSGCNNCAAAP